jgi:hypothetical protein
MAAEKKSMGLRIVLFVVLGVALAALYIDRRARSTSAEADALLSEMDQEAGDRGPETVKGVLNRDPTETVEIQAGIIEHYTYTGGLPGRSYTLGVGYYKAPDGKLHYVAHSLNDPEGDTELAQIVAGYGGRMFEAEDGGSNLGGGGFSGGPPDDQDEPTEEPQTEE